MASFFKRGRDSDDAQAVPPQHVGPDAVNYGTANDFHRAHETETGVTQVPTQVRLDAGMGAVAHAAQPPTDDDMTRDLMLLIGQAIETWAQRHGLANMPKDIIFEQALMALNEMYGFAHEQHSR